MSWVTERSKCSVQEQFKRLVVEVEAVVMERNAILGTNKYLCKSFGDRLEVWNNHGGSVTFGIREGQILVQKNFDGTFFTATPVFGKNDTCFFNIRTDDDSISRLTGEQMIRKGLEEFLFLGFPP